MPFRLTFTGSGEMFLVTNTLSLFDYRYHVCLSSGISALSRLGKKRYMKQYLWKLCSELVKERVEVFGGTEDKKMCLQRTLLC